MNIYKLEKLYNLDIELPEIGDLIEYTFLQYTGRMTIVSKIDNKLFTEKEIYFYLNKKGNKFSIDFFNFNEFFANYNNALSQLANMTR